MYVELYCSSTRGDCNMICWFKQECSHLMPASLVYSRSVIECLLHCLLNIPRNIGDAFFYVITCVYTSWKTVVLLFLFHVLDCNAIFANQDLLPTLRPGNFDLHTKMPGSAPSWAVVHKCPVCADLLLVGRRSERLCRRLVDNTSNAATHSLRCRRYRFQWWNDIVLSLKPDSVCTAG